MSQVLNEINEGNVLFIFDTSVIFAFVANAEFNVLNDVIAVDICDNVVVLKPPKLDSCV